MKPRGAGADGQEVISRRDAIALGQGWYFTGNPCPQGHVSKRSVSNGECRRCVDEKASRQRREGHPRHKEKDRRKYWRDPERTRANQRSSWQKHKEARLAHDRERYHHDESTKLRKLAQARVWWKTNDRTRASARASVQRQRLELQRACPKWLTKNQHAEIRSFYIEARSRDGEWEVDHIWPLKGRTAWGLHVPWNLQVITKNHNRTKRNVEPQA